MLGLSPFSGVLTPGLNAGEMRRIWIPRAGSEIDHSGEGSFGQKDPPTHFPTY
jgi:hypothetical protein